MALHKAWCLAEHTFSIRKYKIGINIMNQATILKVIEVLEKEREQMVSLARHADPSEQQYYKGQESGLRYAVAAIERAIRSE
jgi:hypothetical protein